MSDVVGESFRKIQATKFTMQFYTSCVVCLGRFLFCNISPQANPFSIDIYLCFPFISFFIEINTFKFRSTFVFGCIPSILCSSAKSDVAPSVVQSVSIYMIHNEIIRCIQNKPMHKDIWNVRRISVKPFPISQRVPIKISHTPFIHFINNRVLTLSKWNMYHWNTIKEMPPEACEYAHKFRVAARPEAERHKNTRPLTFSCVRVFLFCVCIIFPPARVLYFC